MKHINVSYSEKYRKKTLNYSNLNAHSVYAYKPIENELCTYFYKSVLKLNQNYIYINNVNDFVWSLFYIFSNFK